MSDTTDDMEIYSGLYEELIESEDHTISALRYIIESKPEDFNDLKHMVNAFKKAARLALKREGIDF